MKRFAAYAEERGHTVERYFCSSDSDSLDGVVLRDAGTGIIDGTAPHCADPKYPGAREEIVNIGRLWDTGLLRGRFDEIKTLCDRKSGLLQRSTSTFGLPLIENREGKAGLRL